MLQAELLRAKQAFAERGAQLLECTLKQSMYRRIDELRNQA
jgi:hypothetical protein